MTFCLVQNLGKPNQTNHDLHEGVNTVGRGFDNSIIVEDEARSLSRHHAEIIVQGQTVLVRDLKSSNGTYVNNQKISQQELKVGDTVRFGNVSFVLQEKAVTMSTATSAKAVPSDISIVMRMTPQQSRPTIQQLITTAPNSPPTGGSMLLVSEQDEAQRTATKLKILMEISNQLTAPQSHAILPQKILELLFQVMQVDRAVVLLANETTGELQVHGVKTRTGIPHSQDFYSKKIVQYVYEQKIGILTDNAVKDDRFDHSQSIIRQSICAAMCVPLVASDKALGVLYVDNLSLTNLYQKEELEFLTILANQAAIAIENANLYRRMQAEATTRARLERFFPEAVSRKIAETGDLGIVETEVTALFSDISGFTEMASQMQPRQVIELLNEYFKVMVEDIVFRFEGTLEKYIADALLAVWGSPYRQEDDAYRALQAAIAMQWGMSELNDKWRKEGRYRHIQIHIGLNTGLVAAGNIGSEKLIQYTNIGDTMNVASRICNVAKGGEILISQSTLDMVRKFTDPPVTALPTVTVKGKSQPLQLYRVEWQSLPPSRLIISQ